MDYFQVALQLIAGLGIYNVWLIRPKRGTGYRGGSANNLKEEFSAYGLPDSAFYIIGFLKLTSATGLILGCFLGFLVMPSAILLALLMIGALAMHLKISDPIKRSVPALIMLTLCMGIIALRYV